uniref:Maturase K n=1 Tax=Acrobeloides nanus TaxID=290746 RepID=A0A914CQ14_9BILA
METPLPFVGYGKQSLYAISFRLIGFNQSLNQCEDKILLHLRYQLLDKWQHRNHHGLLGHPLISSFYNLSRRHKVQKASASIFFSIDLLALRSFYGLNHRLMNLRYLFMLQRKNLLASTDNACPFSNEADNIHLLPISLQRLMLHGPF